MMKLLALILISCSTQAQYVVVGGGEKGVVLGLGAIIKKTVDVGFVYTFPLISAVKPEILVVQAGPLVKLVSWDLADISVTPKAGYSFYRDKGIKNGSVHQHTTYQPAYELELGFTKHSNHDRAGGRISIVANYCREFYYGAILKLIIQ